MWRAVGMLIAGVGVLLGCAEVAVTGSGNLVEETRELADADGVVARGSFEVEVEIGEPARLVVTADDNVIDLVRAEVVDGTLELGLEPGRRARQATLRAAVTLPTVERLEASGSANIVVDGLVTSSDLDVRTSGSARIVADALVGRLTVNASGSSSAWLDGAADEADLRGSGSARLALAPLTLGRATIRMSGSSEAEVRLEGEGTADLSGSARLSWQGGGELVDVQRSGSAEIVPAP